MSDLPIIPLCQVEFLQDFTINFGVYLAAKKPGWARFFQADVKVCEHEGKPLERLTIWIKIYDFTRTNLVLWENKTIWVSIALLAADHHTSEYEVGFYPNFDLVNFDEMLEALDGTVSVSIRLCYGESPVKVLQRIWNHIGEVKTVGTLAKNRQKKSALQK